MRTTFRDVRVTRFTPANVWSARSDAATFAAALARRFARHLRRASENLVLCGARANVKLQSIFKRFQINVAPRFELNSQTEKYYRTVERWTENQMFRQTEMRLAAAPAVDRILNQVTFHTTPHRTVARSERPNLTATQPAVDIAVRRSNPDAFSLPLHRRTLGSFAPVEMVAHQPRRVSSVFTEPERQIETTRSRFESWPSEERQRLAPASDAINIKQLTDQVLEALDRRLVAGHERLTRR